MVIPEKIAAAFAGQSRACLALGSPFMAALMDKVLESLPKGPLLDRIAQWPGEVGPEAASVPLRLAAGFHALALTGREQGLYQPSDDWRGGLAARIAEMSWMHGAFLLRWLDHPPQTNEVGRSAVLIAVAGLLTRRFGLPLVLSELGASAGLNLCFDRYSLRAGNTRLGPPAGPVLLMPDWRGAAPDTQAFRVSERRGCDLNPMDPGTDGLRLMAYVWPDQPDRLARLRAALATAEQGLVDRADAADWLDGRLGKARRGQCHLVYQTVAHQYFPETVQDRIARMMQRAGECATETAPLAWFGMEADDRGEGAGLTLRLWPGDLTITLGRAGFHGQWVDWHQT